MPKAEEEAFSSSREIRSRRESELVPLHVVAISHPRCPIPIVPALVVLCYSRGMDAKSEIIEPGGTLT